MEDKTQDKPQGKGAEAQSQSEKQPAVPYAVFESGGKQHIARIGERLKLDKLSASAGKEHSFDKIIMISNDGKVEIGAPYIEGEKIAVKVIKHGKDDKIRVIKFKRRKHYMRRANFRKSYTEVEVLAFAGLKAQAKPEPKPAAKAKAAAKAETKPDTEADAKATAAATNKESKSENKVDKKADNKTGTEETKK